MKGEALTDNSFLTDLPLAGELVASNFEGWPDWLKTEFVGQTDLVFTTVEHLDRANAPVELEQQTPGRDRSR